MHHRACGDPRLWTATPYGQLSWLAARWTHGTACGLAVAKNHVNRSARLPVEHTEHRVTINLGEGVREDGLSTV